MNFYIFLDIEGTMWNESVADSFSARRAFNSQKVSVESMDTLNYFMFCLAKCGYTPKLVITSGDRRDWEACKAKLYGAGLDENYQLIKLPVNKKLDRWDRIGVMLYDDEKGKMSRIADGNRKYTIFDRIHFKYYQKKNNFAVIQYTADKNYAQMQTITIGNGEQLSMNKVNLFMARNNMSFSIDYLAELEKEKHNALKNNNNRKFKSFYDFLKEGYETYKKEKAIQMEDKIAENVDALHNMAKTNKKIRFKKAKINNNFQNLNEKYSNKEKMPEQTYPLVALEEESKFDFER